MNSGDKIAAAAEVMKIQDPKNLLSSRRLKAMFDASDMTLWRWTRELGFPAPDMVIQRRKFWRRPTIERWLKRMKHKSSPAPAPAARRTARAR